jgi:hypothetical protein
MTRFKHQPTDEEIRRAAQRRSAAKAGKVKIVKAAGGIPCPQCGRPTEIRTHAVITSKMKRQAYHFTQWFYCHNPNCRERAIYRDEDRSDVQERMAGIMEQLRPRR